MGIYWLACNSEKKIERGEQHYCGSLRYRFNIVWIFHFGEENRVQQSYFLENILTGVTPQSKSFKDDGLGPPPAKWKGSCHHFANFSGCNK